MSDSIHNNMRQLLLQISLLCPLVFSGCTAAPVEQYGNLVWSDEFSSVQLDTSKWSFDTGTGAPALTGWGNNELECYTPRTENCRIENGILLIEARKESYQNSAYTSARIKTKGKGDWTYGRFEIRAKLPKGTGIWPAIWMLPVENYYGAWAASGEIDIAEMLGQNPSKVYGTIHYGGVWPNNQSSGDSITLQNGDFSSDFHTFSLEWDSTTLRWYIDTTLYQTISHTQPFDRPFYLILNVAVGGTWPGPPDTSTTFPVQMAIDYVRVYGGTNATGAANNNNVSKQQVHIDYSLLLRGVNLLF